MDEKTLNQMAIDMVGDGKGPNMYFVSNAAGDIVTASQSFEIAYAHWRQLSQARPRHECALEDRVHGVLACVQPDEKETQLIILDDSYMLLNLTPRQPKGK